jgi:hypothetical protein
MQAASTPITHVAPDSQIFTDGWDPRDWQKQQEQQQEQRQHAAAPIAPTMPQLYRPALVPPSTHPAFAAAVVAAGAPPHARTPPSTLNEHIRLQMPSINIKRTHSLTNANIHNPTPAEEGSSSEIARLRASNRYCHSVAAHFEP